MDPFRPLGGSESRKEGLGLPVDKGLERSECGVGMGNDGFSVVCAWPCIGNTIVSVRPSVYGGYT